MTDQYSFPFFDLTLDDSVVERTKAVFGDRELDHSLLAELVEMGLEAAERSAAMRERGCSDPYCGVCRRNRGEQPLPWVLAELSALSAQLERVRAATPPGQEAFRPVSMALPEKNLIAMAWLDRMMEAHGRGGLRVVAPEIDMADPAMMERAARYLSNVLALALEREFADFAEDRHPLLYPPPPLVEDDEMPF